MVFEALDDVGDKPVLDDGGGMDHGDVPVEKPLLRHNYRLLDLENFQEGTQDLHSVDRVDGGAFGYNVGVDEALGVIAICLVLAAWTLALMGPGVPFFMHCFDCFFV